MASAGFHTSPWPCSAHVPGMNWAIPIAPTPDWALGLKPDSWCSWAASTAGVTSLQPALAAASMIIGRYSGGIPSPLVMTRLRPEPLVPMKGPAMITTTAMTTKTNAMMVPMRPTPVHSSHCRRYTRPAPEAMVYRPGASP